VGAGRRSEVLASQATTGILADPADPYYALTSEISKTMP
jgi:hypothetical protein